MTITHTENQSTKPAFSIKTQHRQLLADTITPVSIYLKLRDKFVNSILLESSDYHGNEDAFSYICCEPIARFELSDNEIYTKLPDGSETKVPVINHTQVLESLQAFAGSFEQEELKFPFIYNGLFGYMAYPAVQHFEDIAFKSENHIPDIVYQVFKYVIAINHFKNEMFVFEHSPAPEGEMIPESVTSGLDYIISLIQNKNFPSYQFHLQGEEKQNMTDEAFMEMVEKGKYHCRIGDVFQIVLSRRFEQAFKGDEFNVYRALRSVNPSPYLFYFDFGNYKIFGSSPETQISIKGDTAAIYPIAGTFRRTGNDKSDAELAQKLFDDPKESAEHVMLVDLARNDLSRHSHDVKVETFKEVQYFSHVIHLVSKVTGKIMALQPPKGEFGYETADPVLYSLLKEFAQKHRSNPTQAEDILWNTLSGKKLEGYKFRRQHIIGEYIADFVCLKQKLIVEVDGLIHELPENKISDIERTVWLNKNGFNVLRFTNDEVIRNTSEVLEKILHALQQAPPSGAGGALQLVADTFPAGTLSGAPKHKAMQLIDKYEPTNRSYYGGCIGFMGFNGDFNHAIMIRSFLSKNNTLYFQAGAGVVAKSVKENELQEVNNKLGALRKALKMAEMI